MRNRYDSLCYGKQLPGKVGKSVNVISEGGSVRIDLENGFAYMTGPAVKICEGNLEV